MASGALDQTPAPETAFRGLIALDLDSLRVVHRLPIEGDGSPADITVGADGTVYASDPVRGTIYRVGVGDTVVSTWSCRPGGCRTRRGWCRRPTGAGSTSPIMAMASPSIDLNDGSVTRLESDVATMLDGIDGLVALAGGLIAVQNGTSPRRIVHLTLDRRRPPDHRDARSWKAAIPTGASRPCGFVARQRVLYVADAQWERYGAGGALVGEGADPPDRDPQPGPPVESFGRPRRLRRHSAGLEAAQPSALESHSDGVRRRRLSADPAVPRRRASACRRRSWCCRCSSPADRRGQPYPDKLAEYECGFPAFEDSRAQFDVRFYLVAILFIVFDLEAAFLFPWAVSVFTPAGRPGAR